MTNIPWGFSFQHTPESLLIFLESDSFGLREDSTGPRASGCLYKEKDQGCDQQNIGRCNDPERPDLIHNHALPAPYSPRPGPCQAFESVMCCIGPLCDDLRAC